MPAVDRFQKMVSAAQASGQLPALLDSRFLLRALVALSVFPIGFPEASRIVSGLYPGDPEFQRQHADFVERLFGCP